VADLQKTTTAAKLRVLQQAFAEQLPERLAIIHNTWVAVQQRPEHSKELYRLIHSLAGSAGTFGFQRLGKEVRLLEEFLMQLTDAAYNDTKNKLTINRALAEFDALASGGADNAQDDLSASIIQATTGKENDRALVYVLEDDHLLAPEIVSQLEHFGYDAESFSMSADIILAQQKCPADALILDIALPEGDLEGTRIAPQLQALAESNVPLIFISARDDWAARLAALRAGGRAYFKKPLDFSAMVEKLDRLRGADMANPFRILIVEDSVLLADHYAAVLQVAGMNVEVINDSAQLLDSMSDFAPELILMDLYMPHCSGIEAAQIIRQHSSYQGLPIVYLSTESGLNQQLDALKMGGDDFLQKPIADDHLVAAISIRAQRFRGLNTLMTCDSLTGLLNHITLKLTLESELALLRRQAGVLSFAMLDIDDFKSINDRYGHPVGDRVIKSLARLLMHRLRKSDTVARYGGEEFAVIFPNTSAEAAHALIDDLRQSFEKILFTHEASEFSVTFSAGVATASPQGDVASLIEAADNSLYKAKHGGRNTITPLGGSWNLNGSIF